MLPTWDWVIVGFRLADGEPAWRATMTSWPTRCSGDRAAYAVSTQEAVGDGVGAALVVAGAVADPAAESDVPGFTAPVVQAVIVTAVTRATAGGRRRRRITRPTVRGRDTAIQVRHRGGGSTRGGTMTA